MAMEWAQTAEPSVEERRAIESQITGDGPIEEALAAATSVLSGLSACAGVVLVPKRDAVLKAFSFARLSDTQVLAIMVGTDNSVENRVALYTRRSVTARWSRHRIIFPRGSPDLHCPRR